eukprot:6182977-Pleurochrysis_carterae.AAC.4
MKSYTGAGSWRAGDGATPCARQRRDWLQLAGINRAPEPKHRERSPAHPRQPARTRARAPRLRCGAHASSCPRRCSCELTRERDYTGRAHRCACVCA